MLRVQAEGSQKEIQTNLESKHMQETMGRLEEEQPLRTLWNDRPRRIAS